MAGIINSTRTHIFLEVADLYWRDVASGSTSAAVVEIRLLRTGEPVAGSCECGDEHSGSGSTEFVI
jgi:hypothetical protein